MTRKFASTVLQRLQRSIPDPTTELEHRNPFELLVATILSAQCTDERVNQVTRVLFSRYPNAAALAATDRVTLEELVRPTGFYRNKARLIHECAQALEERFAGRVPDTLEELVTLPGVGRKTANLILGQCFGKPGIVVDTHVKRVANRLGFTHREDPDEIEQELQKWLPRKSWSDGSSRLLLHGRRVCQARKPMCPECCLNDLCPSSSLR
ncbi:MAG: endonuclease III [Candidatus Eremiobacterota bacterium]